VTGPVGSTGPDAPAGGPATVRPFGERLADVLADAGPLCVGVDPHDWLLDAWGLGRDAAGVREFGLRVVEATAGGAGVVKPQVAFFERFGSGGLAALEEVLAAARAAGLLVVGDAKRGDVGSTMAAYAEAWTSPTSPLRVDALTVSPYLGVGALAGAASAARASGAGLFVLGATSNAEAHDLQSAVTATGPRAGRTVAAGIVEDVLDDNAAAGETRLGSIGLVLGATVDLADRGVDVSRLTTTPVLAPGFGAQGATFADLPRRFGPAARSVLASVSRDLLSAGPRDLASAVLRSSEEARSCLA